MGQWVKEGSRNIANIYLKNQLQNSQLYLGLYTNEILADLNDADLSWFTEPTATNYARAVLAPANWVVADEVSVYPAIEFEVSLEQFGTIYGCFIGTTLDSSGLLLAAHTFSVPIELLYYGDRLEITPRIIIT